MIKYILLIFLTALLSCKKEIIPSRTQNFPKNELQVEKVPEKENVWVFMLAGQSNMAGRGLVEPQDTIPSHRVLTINKDAELIVAKEPLHFYEPTMTGLDLGLSFGKELIRHLPDSISVLIIPTAVGGSGITHWLEDQVFRNVQLFSNFKEKAIIGQQYGTMKGILWQQGESDAVREENTQLYQQRLSKLTQMFREVTGNDRLPVIFGELGSFSKNREQWEKINEQIRKYASTDSLTGIVETGDMKDKGDKVHFDSESLRIMGQRFAQEYLNILNDSSEQ